MSTTFDIRRWATQAGIQTAGGFAVIAECVTMDELQRFAEIAIASAGGVQALSAAPAEADMFWDAEDGERFGNDIDDIISDFGPGDRVKINCAKRMPSIEVLVVADGDDLTYQIVSPTPPAEQQAAPKAAPVVDKCTKQQLTTEVLRRMQQQEDGHNKNPFRSLLDRLMRNEGGYSTIEIGQLKYALDGFYGAARAPADSVLEDAGGANWQDISTAPKDGARFVAVGNNYGLYSETQHVCIAQWFRGSWIEASEWNEASELTYLTHWMPLPSPPDDVAAPAEQQAPKAAPTWPSEVLVWEALQAYLKHDTNMEGMRAALIVGAAPQQEAQEPGEIPESIERMATGRYKVVPSHESMFHRWAVVAGNGERQLYLGREVECQNMARKFAGAFLDGAFVAMQQAAPQPAPAPLSDDVVKDAARYRWLREGNDAKHGAAWHVAVNLYGCEWDAAIDAALAAQGGKDAG